MGISNIFIIPKKYNRLTKQVLDIFPVRNDVLHAAGAVGCKYSR